MDIVLGVSMTPSAVRMVLVEGENADGRSVDHDALDITPGADPAKSDAPQQVLDAILGTRESAAEGGHRLTSVGVAWTDHAAAALLREGLRRHRLSDVVLVSELHAASALAQAIGQTVGSQGTALLFVERDTATLAVVRTADGAVVRVISRSLPAADPVTELQGMVAGLDAGAEPAQAVFMVGSGVDIAALEPQIAAATNLPVHAPADGDLALARGAALAAASTPRYEASTVGMASSEDTVGGVTQMAAAGYMAPLGYSAVPDGVDEDLLAYDGPAIAADAAAEEPSRKSFLLLGSALSTVFVIGVAALAISLAVVIRPTGDQRPEPVRNPVVSSVPAPVPAQAKDAAPPAAPETIQAPIPVVQEAPRTVVVAPPAARAPAPVPVAAPEAVPAPAVAPPAPAPAPAAPPAPAPASVPSSAPARVAPPVVVPVPILLPPIFQAPVRTAPVPRTPPTTATYPTNPSTPTYSPAPSSPSYPTSTPPVTTNPTYPSNSNPPASTQAPSTQAPSTRPQHSGSRHSGSQHASSSTARRRFRVGRRRHRHRRIGEWGLGWLVGFGAAAVAVVARRGLTEGGLTMCAVRVCDTWLARTLLWAGTLSSGKFRKGAGHEHLGDRHSPRLA